MTNLRNIEAEAERILEAHAIHSVPVPVEDIARKENIKIGTASSKDVSGVLLRKEGVAFIALNSDESQVRRRFTLAHELGHYFLHPNKNTFIEYRDNKEQKIDGEKILRTPKEREANKFAAALLMPRKTLVKDVAAFVDSGVTEDHVIFLANKYGVSEKAMTFRLMNLNLN